MDSARHPRQPMLLAIVFLLCGIEFLQSGAIAFGNSAILGQISASPEQFVLVTVLYAAMAITTVAMHHWCIERMGWRAYIQWSALLFIAGAAICGSSHDFGQFVLGRATMAIGGAGFMTAARLLINLIPPSPQRMKGIAAFGFALALGNGLAPWMVTASVEADRWWLIFAIPASMAVLIAVLAQATLPVQTVPAGVRTETTWWTPLAILACGLFGLYGLDRAAFDFYDDAVPLLVYLGISFGAGALVVRQQLRQDHPLIDVRALLQLRFLCGLALFAFCYVILGANNTMLPVLLQRALGASFSSVGEVQTLGLMSSVLAFLCLLLVMKRKPAPRKFYVVGFGFLFYFAWQLARLNAGASLIDDALPAIAAFGVFLILVLATTAIHTFVELQRSPIAFNHGQMVKNMMSQFGIALGIAGASVGLQWRTTEHFNVLAERFHQGDAVFTALRDQLAAAVGPQQALAQLTQMLNQQATLLAGLDYFSLLMVAALGAGLLMTVQRVFK